MEPTRSATATDKKFAGSGRSLAVSTTRSEPATKELPALGRRLAVICCEAAVKTLPSERTRSVWLNDAEKIAKSKDTVSGN